MTRRNLVGTLAVGSLAAAAGRAATHTEWKPRLGVLGPYTRGNVAWAKEHGFSNMILGSGPGRNATLDATRITDAEIEKVKAVLDQHQMHVSALQVSGDSINPDMAERQESNNYFVKAIELAGKLGVPYIGTQAGRNRHKKFEDQVDEIVRVYNETFFKACEANKVRILWEPYPEAANLATSPVAFTALFKAFGDSPYVGLQFDPSHFVRQFMDPIETAWQFKDKIYDVHLKDTEILWPVLRAGGISPVNDAKWWRYRIPGMGSIVWRDFFSVLQDIGYTGAMSVEQEDDLYGADHNPGPDFADDFKTGFVMAKKYLDQYVPEYKG